jgi:hypothetical protein
MPDEFPRHSVRDASGFEQGGGRVTERMKANFVLLTQDVSAFAGAVMDALVSKFGCYKNLVKLVAKISGTALPLHRGIGAWEKFTLHRLTLSC